MRFKYFFFCILLFYNTEAKPRQVMCPEYCSCDLFNNFRRAICQSKMLVSVEIGMPPEAEILDLSYNQISELGNKVFLDMGMTELKLLNLSNNKISQIHMFGFEGLENLKSLDLSFNIIEYFLEQWFVSLKSLQELYLKGNSLVLINKQPTLNLPSLKILDISQSKIEHFNPNVFTLLPNLEILDISSNYIQRLNVEVIIPLTSLNLLVATDNNLVCKEMSMRALRHHIRKNQIRYVGPCMKSRKTTVSPNLVPLIVDIPVENNAESEKLAKSDIAEVVNKSRRNKGLESINNSNDTEKIENSNKLNKVSDAEILDDLEKFVNSEKFEKMRMETPATNIIQPENPVDFNNTEFEISTDNKLKKVEDADILDDLKQFFESEKIKEVSVSDNNAQPNKITPTNAPETSGKNAWMVDDEILKGEKDINYLEVCNGTKKHPYYNVLDKMAMEILEISPSLFLLLFTAFGLMLGMVIGCSVQIENLPKKIPKFDKKGGFLDWFKRKKPNKKEQQTDPNQTEMPIDEDEVVREEDDPSNSAAPKEKNDDDSDCDICEEEREMLNNREKNRGSRRSSRSGKSPKRTKSPFEDQTFLLDNELLQDGTTPVLAKKEFS